MSDKHKFKDISTDKIVDAIIHLYRGEIQRVNTWRNRLDTTPNWAIVMTAGIITWVFSGATRTPALILVIIPLVGGLMVLEARRYQMHEIWRSRLRLLEENFFAPILNPNKPSPREQWMAILAKDLRVPEHKSTLMHSIGVRLRRIYLWIFLTVILAWILKLSLQPSQLDSLNQLVDRARIGLIPGMVVLAFLCSLLVGLVSLAMWSKKLEFEDREGEIPEEEPGYEWRRENEIEQQEESQDEK